MYTEVATRIIVAVGLIGIGVTLWVVANRWLLARAARNVGVTESGGIPTIMYFTTPTCAPCKTMQRPALDRLKQQLGDGLKVVEIDASTQIDLAQQWGVLSVPTTFVLDASGKPRHVNHGPTSAAKLLKQLETVPIRQPINHSI